MTNSSDECKIDDAAVEKFRGQLLDWYDSHARSLPWRAPFGVVPDPYHVWLSEIMLQQTTVGAVMSYYVRFLELWPTVYDLAAADRDLVLKEWAGLGYYARARNLHACAQYVSEELGGVFPDTQKELMTLKGVGDYTSAAITAIAFNKPATVVDGNVERVMARYFADTQPLPDVKKALKRYAHYFFEGYADRPGDLAQAFMDLGATICTPKSPKCMLCPVSEGCAGYAKGIASDLPKRTPKKAKPQKRGYVYWAEDDNGCVFLERRSEKAMLGGMLGFPTSEWVEKGMDLKHLSGVAGDVSDPLASVFHSFTHFDLELIPVRVQTDDFVCGGAFESVAVNELAQAGFPTLFKKAWKVFVTS